MSNWRRLLIAVPLLLSVTAVLPVSAQVPRARLTTTSLPIAGDVRPYAAYLARGLSPARAAVARQLDELATST